MVDSKEFSEVSDLNIRNEKILTPAKTLINKYPILKKSHSTVKKSREELVNIIHGKNKKVVAIVGPCSIHDTNSALEYASKLKKEIHKFDKEILILMRVYFEKPRTNIGWKGFISDPNLNNSYDINKGLELARKLLLNITAMGIPCATEFINVIISQYFTDLISWGAIGARTVESQIHRELASGLSAPIGFKNTTNGNIEVTVNAVKTATYPHHFLGTTRAGATAIYETKGNKNSHVILRGSALGPNFSQKYVDECTDKLKQAKINTKIIVDCSHDNSQKDYKKQKLVLADICKQISQNNNICGTMIESNLISGNQDINKKPLEYGKSVTDACVDFDETIDMLEALAKAVQKRKSYL